MNEKGFTLIELVVAIAVIVGVVVLIKTIGISTAFTIFCFVVFGLVLVRWWNRRPAKIKPASPTS